jgi:hypothetical protein
MKPKCMARLLPGANDPQDCDWPCCGCDPYADKVVAALLEAGYRIELPPPSQHNSDKELMHRLQEQVADAYCAGAVSRNVAAYLLRALGEELADPILDGIDSRHEADDITHTFAP